MWPLHFPSHPMLEMSLVIWHGWMWRMALNDIVNSNNLSDNFWDIWLKIEDEINEVQHGTTDDKRQNDDIEKDSALELWRWWIINFRLFCADETEAPNRIIRLSLSVSTKNVDSKTLRCRLWGKLPHLRSWAEWLTVQPSGCAPGCWTDDPIGQNGKPKWGQLAN